MGNAFMNPGFAGIGGYGGGFDGFEGAYDAGAMGAADGVIKAVLGIFFGILLVMLVVSILMYVLQAVSMYSIAKRRKISNPWLAWVPIGSNWILGSISDQYQYVVKGKIRNRRKVLLGLNIAAIAISLIYEIVNIVMVVNAVLSDSEAGMLQWAITMLVLALVMLVIAIVQCVFVYIALYDLYTSCDPDNNLTYLLLSIFLGITMPFLMFACRKHDRGMPPRKEAPQALPAETAQPAPAPEAPAEEIPVEEAPAEPAPAEQPEE